MAIPIHQKHQIPQNGTFQQTVEPISVCLFRLSSILIEINNRQPIHLMLYFLENLVLKILPKY